MLTKKPSEISRKTQLPHNLEHTVCNSSFQNSLMVCVFFSFSPSDMKFVTCSDDVTIKIWDFAKCTEESVLTGIIYFGIMCNTYLKYKKS